VLPTWSQRQPSAAARPRGEIFARHELAIGIHLYMEAASSVADMRCGCSRPVSGVIEDPATGSANVALIALLAALHAELDLRLEQRISQGVDMGRPSLVVASAEKRAGKIVAAHIGGSCMPVVSGVITLTA